MTGVFFLFLFHLSLGLLATLPFVPDRAGVKYFKFCTASAAFLTTAGLGLAARRFGWAGGAAAPGGLRYPLLLAGAGAFLLWTVLYNRAWHFDWRRARAPLLSLALATGVACVLIAAPERGAWLVCATDLTSALLLGAAAAKRFGIRSVRFVQTDLLRSGLKPESFDVVYSAGVLHHTAQPARAFARVAELARPGGIVIVGVYNAVARLPLRVRRTVARATQFRVVPFDPVLRERHHEPARRTAWLRDQYQHPEEHSHTVGEIKRWFFEKDVQYLRSFPSTVLDDESQDLFACAIDDWKIERWIAQLGWMWTLSGEGGLFVAIGRRR